MAFSDFDLRHALEAFGLTEERDTDLFAHHTADTFLALNLTPKEISLTGITIDQLLSKGLTKKAFVNYAAAHTNALDVLVYLCLEPVHFTRLGLRRSDLARWEPAAVEVRQIALLLQNLPQE